MSPQAEAVTWRLASTARSWWGFSVLTGACWSLAASLGVLLAFALADLMFHLNQLGLWLLFGVWAALTGCLAAAVVLRACRGPRSLEATARRLEMEYPQLRSNLINLVQLSDLEDEEVGPFGKAAVKQAAGAVEDFPFEDAPSRKTRRDRFQLGMQTPRDFAEASGLLGAVLAGGVALFLLSAPWASSLFRILQPWEFVPAVGSVHITNVTPGDTQLPVGAPLQIAAEIENPEGEPYPATLFLQYEGEPETALTLLPDKDNRKFTASLPQVLGSLRYRLEIGDSQTERYTVTVRQKPTVAEVKVTYIYPAYLGRPEEEQVQKQGDLEGPQFTLARLQVRPSAPIARGHLEIDGQRIPGYVTPEKDLLVYMLLKQSTTYTIHLFNDAGHTDAEPRVNQIRVVPDEPPWVQLAEPARESSAAPGGKVTIAVRAGDDHGLGQVWIEAKPSNEAPAQILARWDKFGAEASVVRNHQLILDPKTYKAGQTVLVRAVARDRRQVDVDRVGFQVKLGPQEAATPWHTIRLVALEAKAKKDLARIDQLRAGLFKLLRQQVDARVALAPVPRQKSAAESRRLVGQVRAAQVALQKETAALVGTIPGADKEEAVIKRALNKLAFNEMLLAVRQAEALAAAPEGAQLGKPVKGLLNTQDAIIDVLRRLLQEARREAAQTMAEMKNRPDNQLPSDVQSKLKDLHEKLREFLKQQKKVIEASEGLQKKGMEDYTDKEKELLKQLAAIEDDWSRFLADKHSDLSKLPEQDFSNPSLLKEMVEVQTQLKMAKDALTAKSADIAVPLEQLGAEMAKEMTTNIEKWLPDTPDREKWSQEEPVTDDMKEAPMAELPKELEDIVGDLMEQEEDLFEEMEDVSSSWADSLDKGAGWDAMDGPISNNSARGVTGNRLPNTSEIGGRSGEGRSGKSSGEFVGEEAEGKGGRKTPTRLTGEPHTKGKIQDKSKDPTGGATGGGKESGVGGQGLQGPQPDKRQRELQRLAQKQAELRNKAESVDLKFQVLHYHRSDLQKMIDAMAAIEQDLRSGRYQSALRRRQVMLQGLGRVRSYVKGETTIRQDRTANLPTDIQKDILGSMKEPAPPGWDQLNRKYFERLAFPQEKK